LTIAVLALALVLGGLGAGLAVAGRGGVTTTVSGQTSTGAPYVVTLVIATNSIYNSTALDQPAYFVLGPHGLQSSASISVPVGRLIELVIVNNDDGNATFVQPDVNKVNGTTGDTVFIASNDNINASEGVSGIYLRGGQNLTTVPADSVSHTFTVPSLSLNVPVAVSSTVVAYFRVGKAGTYVWFCMTDCGEAAMSTPGWMTGSLVAS
jgi:hypothetical protein